MTAGLVGISMLAWMFLITMQHRREHRHGPGRGLLIGAWALTVLMQIFLVQRAADTAAIDDGFVDAVLSFYGDNRAYYGIWFFLPLVLASWAILGDLGELGGKIAGRRIRIADLLDADLLVPGEKIRLDDPRSGLRYHAEITENGAIRLPGGGGVWSDPSKAAMLAANMNKVNGWRAWKLERTGQSLADVRSVHIFPSDPFD